MVIGPAYIDIHKYFYLLIYLQRHLQTKDLKIE